MGEISKIGPDSFITSLRWSSIFIILHNILVAQNIAVTGTPAVDILDSELLMKPGKGWNNQFKLGENCSLLIDNKLQSSLFCGQSVEHQISRMNR